MRKFLKNLLGKGRGETPEEFVSDLLQNILDKSYLEISFDLDLKETERGKQIHIEFFGQDEGLLLTRDASLLDELQFFLRTATRHNFQSEFVAIYADCDNYRKRKKESLLSLVEKLKGSVLKNKKPLYLKPLSSGQRRLVHEYLSEDKRIKTQSIGSGSYKKIKIQLSRNE